MLPIVDRPVIQYIVDEALAAGLDQIIIVTSASKRAIEDHFDRDLELEQVLEAGGKLAYLDAVRKCADVSVAFVRQKERLGNGHALLMARHLLRDEPFAVLFPDDVIFHEAPAIRQIMDIYEQHGCTVLAVQQVPREQVSLYGVIDPRPVGPRLYEVNRVVEKPPADEAPSNLTTVGRFVCTPDLLDVLGQTPPGRAGEIWLMDAFDTMARRGRVLACEYEGVRFDTGQPTGLLKAALYVGLRNEAVGPELRAFIRSLEI
jgi:UTP--glucose-1-phosphate uridylyltransferase